ncbi:hypothetical protein A2U01_0070924, partial [Trifolium medium]|nr:hypothetical protein [Trifolium medium]
FPRHPSPPQNKEGTETFAHDDTLGEVRTEIIWGARTVQGCSGWRCDG